MGESASRLSEREREVLRLLLRGHDAKSAARSLDISVHAVNERLREARRKLGVSSSREAARILAANERDVPNSSVAKEIGVGAGPGIGADRPAPDGQAAGGTRPFNRWIVGGFMILLFVAAMGVWSVSDRDQSIPPPMPASPRVVATAPRQGAAIAPGDVTLSVTFDRAMRPGNYSFVQMSADTYPDCGASQPVQSRDGRTFTLHCRTQPDRHYEIWFNSPPYLNFKSVDGVAAEPYQLLFRTRSR